MYEDTEWGLMTQFRQGETTSFRKNGLSSKKVFGIPVTAHHPRGLFITPRVVNTLADAILTECYVKR